MWFSPFWFFIAFAIGFVTVLFTTPEPEYIIKYPTPDNAGKVIYRDSNDVCYKYIAKEVSCPADKTQLKTIPIQ